jgi:hypothetical protein
VDTYAPPAVEMPEGAVGNDWLEAAKALAPLTKSMTDFVQGIEKDRREQSPEQAKQIIEAFNGDLSFLKDMPTMSREDVSKYLKSMPTEFPGLKEEYAGRADFVLYAQALAGSRYVREAQTIEGPNGTMVTVGEALNSRLEEAMQPGVDAAAIRKEVREKFLESIGTPQSEAWNMALLDGLTPLERSWDQRVREGKAANVAWQADQDFKDTLSSKLFDLEIHMAHPATPDDALPNETPDEATRRQERNATKKARHEEQAKLLSDAVKNVYAQAGKVGDRKRNTNTLSAIEMMLRQVAADDDDGLELAEAISMLQEVEYADGQVFGDSKVFREGLSKIELEIRREQAALETSKDKTEPSDTQVMSIAAHDIVLPFLREQGADTPEAARQLAEQKRAEVEKLLKDSGLDPRLATTVFDDATTFYTRAYSGDPEPNTEAARSAKRRFEEFLGTGQLTQAEAVLIGHQDDLGSGAADMLEQLQEAKKAFRNQDTYQRQVTNLVNSLFPEGARKTLRPSAQPEMDDLLLEAEQELEALVLELPLLEREKGMVAARQQVAKKYQERAQALIEDASVANNPDQLIAFNDLDQLLQNLAMRELDIQGTPLDEDKDGRPDRFVLSVVDQIAVDELVSNMTFAARDQARKISGMDWGGISAQEKVQAIRRALISGNPEMGIKGYGSWISPVLQGRSTSAEPAPVNIGMSQKMITAPVATQSSEFGAVASFLEPVVGNFASIRTPSPQQPDAVRDLLGISTGYLGGEAPFFGPYSLGEIKAFRDRSDPEVRASMMEDYPQFEKGLERYSKFYPSQGRQMRLHLAGIVDGMPLPDDDATGDDGFDQIGQGLKPLLKQSTEQVVPYLREAVAATGLSFAEVNAGRIAESNMTLSRLFPKDSLFASGVHIGPFTPSKFDAEVAAFENPETRESSNYGKALRSLGVDLDAELIGNDRNGQPFPAGLTQGEFAMGRIKSRYNRLYRANLPELDLKAMDIPLHELGRMQVNEVPPMSATVMYGFIAFDDLEKVSDVPTEDLKDNIHGPLIQHVVRNSRALYSTDAPTSEND